VLDQCDCRSWSLSVRQQDKEDMSLPFTVKATQPSRELFRIYSYCQHHITCQRFHVMVMAHRTDGGIMPLSYGFHWKRRAHKSSTTNQGLVNTLKTEVAARGDAERPFYGFTTYLSVLRSSDICAYGPYSVTPTSSRPSSPTDVLVRRPELLRSLFGMVALENLRTLLGESPRFHLCPWYRFAPRFN